ncbi:hypothetical protein L9F63_010773, partial [Diploptera punctata]
TSETLANAVNTAALNLNSSSTIKNNTSTKRRALLLPQEHTYSCNYEIFFRT